MPSYDGIVLPGSRAERSHIAIGARYAQQYAVVASLDVFYRVPFCVACAYLHVVIGRLKGKQSEVLQRCSNLDERHSVALCHYRQTAVGAFCWCELGYTAYVSGSVGNDEAVLRVGNNQFAVTLMQRHIHRTNQVAGISVFGFRFAVGTFGSLKYCCCDAVFTV